MVFLNNQIEAITFPVFERNYEILSKRLRSGECLDVPIKIGIKREKVEVLDNKKLKEKLSKIRKDLDI